MILRQVKSSAKVKHFYFHVIWQNVVHGITDQEKIFKRSGETAAGQIMNWILVESKVLILSPGLEISVLAIPR